MIQMQFLGAQTEEGLLNVLLEEEDRRKNKKGAKHEGDALSTQGNRGSKKGGFQKGNSQSSGGGETSSKRIGKDGAWGELGKAPPGSCHGCHLPGHPWAECRRRPEGAVPAHIRDKKEGKSTGQ